MKTAAYHRHVAIALAKAAVQLLDTIAKGLMCSQP